MKVLFNDTWPRNVCFLYFDQDGLLAQGNQELIMRIFNKIPKRSPDGKRLQVHYLLLCLLSVLILTEVRIVEGKKTHLLADECIMDSITTRGSAYCSKKNCNSTLKRASLLICDSMKK